MQTETTTETETDQPTPFEQRKRRLLDGMFREDRDRLAELREDLEVERAASSVLIESYEEEIAELAADIERRERAVEQAARDAADRLARAVPLARPGPRALGLLSAGFAVAALVSWLSGRDE